MPDAKIILEIFSIQLYNRQQEKTTFAFGRMIMDIIGMLASELKLAQARVQAVVQLLDEGKTVPFIARYRKELTGGMDDQLLLAFRDRPEEDVFTPDFSLWDELLRLFQLLYYLRLFQFHLFLPGKLFHR